MLPWIFTGVSLKVNEAPGNIQGNLTAFKPSIVMHNDTAVCTGEIGEICVMFRQNTDHYNSHEVTYLYAQWYTAVYTDHDDVIKWKQFPRHWPFVRGIHRSPVNSPHKGQWRGALMFSLIWAWTNSWANNGDAGDLRRHRAHYDVIVMGVSSLCNRLVQTQIVWSSCNTLRYCLWRFTNVDSYNLVIDFNTQWRWCLWSYRCYGMDK